MSRGYGDDVSKVRTFTSSPLPPYDRGLELGERLRTEVAACAAAYRRLFAVRAVRPFHVDLWSDRAWEAIRRLAPTAAEEIAGIAEGARGPVREGAAVNARTELLAAANPTGTTECSTVVSVPPGRPPVAVQTWDWYDAMADDWMHWTIPSPDGRVVETVTEVGMLAKIGVNGYGVGVLLNMLHHASDVPDDGTEPSLGYPVHLLSRRILEDARDLDEAVAIATTGPMSASTSLTVVEGRERSGRAVSVELFPAGHGLVEPNGDLLVRTNHFVSEAGAAGCTAHTIGPGTRIRRDKLVDALTGTTPAPVEVLDAMHDHADEGGVCVHPDTSLDPDEWHATLATVTLDTAGRRLDVVAGGPCAR